MTSFRRTRGWRLVVFGGVMAGLLGLGCYATARPRWLRPIAAFTYNTKMYAVGALAYERLAERERFAGARADAHCRAARCRARAGQPAAALRELAAVPASYANADQMRAEEDLASLRPTRAFQQLLRRARRPTVPTDPDQAQLVTTDIDLFWRAYDHAQRDPAHAAQIYDQEYFDRGSVGLQDYYTLKIRNTDLFVKNQRAKPEFYRAIRPNTLRLAAIMPQIRAGFRKLKELYPEARFPSVYFVIGRWTSGGTASDNGMLIGADQLCGTPGTPLSELNLWERNNFKSAAGLPGMVAHEQIHYIQRQSNDPSLLRGALDEGMADFLGELTTGQNINKRLQAYGRTHEKEIWADFTKEMVGKNWSNWIANSDQETAEKPADLGYFVGYQICRSYYEEAADKKQAVHDILNISDYPAFLAESRYAAKLAAK